METNAVECEIKAVVPTARGAALFLGYPKKTFVIYIDQVLGQAISMIQNKIVAERPLTHDLIAQILQGLSVSLERVVINHTHNGTFFARLILKMENELGTKMVEIDARPSDSIILALRLARPIYVAQSVLESVEDMTDTLERIQRDKNA